MVARKVFLRTLAFRFIMRVLGTTPEHFGGGKMSHRCLAAVLTVIAVVALTPMFASAQSAEVPRTPWGAPDLQGVWDFRTVTP